MRIRYTVPFAARTEFFAHWASLGGGGTYRVVEKNSIAEALGIVFDNQPLDTAPVFLHVAPVDVKYEMRVSTRSVRRHSIMEGTGNVAAR
jgi:hypothetical protein